MMNAEKWMIKEKEKTMLQNLTVNCDELNLFFVLCVFF